MNAYEKQREDRIRRNNEVLVQMGILTAASAFNEAVIHSTRQGAVTNHKQGQMKATSQPAPDAEPARRSSRLRGEAPAVQCYGNTENHRHEPTTTLPNLCFFSASLCLLPSAEYLPLADEKTCIHCPH